MKKNGAILVVGKKNEQCFLKVQEKSREGERMESGEVLAIATAVYNEYFRGFSEWREDLIAEGVLGILVCEQRYDATKGKLVVYAWRSAWGRMMSYAKVECRAKLGRVDLTEVDNYISEQFKSCLEETDIIKELGQVRMRKELQNAIVERILSGERECDVADKLGVSRQYVSLAWNKWKRKVHSRFEFIDGNIEPKRSGK